MLRFTDKLPGGKDKINSEKIKTLNYFLKNSHIFKIIISLLVLRFKAI